MENMKNKEFGVENYINIARGFKLLENPYSMEANRYLGAMEGILLMHGVIKPEESFEFKQIPYEERKFLFFGSKKTYYRKQEYWEYMYELFMEFIKEQIGE